VFLVSMESSRQVDGFRHKTRSDWWPDWPNFSWEDEKWRARKGAFARIFRPPAALADRGEGVGRRADELGWWRRDKERREERENGRGREEEKRARERKKQEEEGQSDSTGPIRFGSIRPVRFRIQNFEFLLCLGIKNEAQKF